MSLSNICELMDADDTYKLFKEISRTAKNGSRLIFRNLMVPCEVPESLQCRIIKNEIVTKELQNTDRSFVYGKVAAYEVKK
jgi:S-adenosylmethionine-diacylglycerol 3-amino-3-carboxypropyl transferase